MLKETLSLKGRGKMTTTRARDASWEWEKTGSSTKESSEEAECKVSVKCLSTMAVDTKASSETTCPMAKDACSFETKRSRTECGRKEPSFHSFDYCFYFIKKDHSIARGNWSIIQHVYFLYSCQPPANLLLWPLEKGNACLWRLETNSSKDNFVCLPSSPPHRRCLPRTENWVNSGARSCLALCSDSLSFWQARFLKIAHIRSLTERLSQVWWFYCKAEAI